MLQSTGLASRDVPVYRRVKPKKGIPMTVREMCRSWGRLCHAGFYRSRFRSGNRGMKIWICKGSMIQRIALEFPTAVGCVTHLRS